MASTLKFDEPRKQSTATLVIVAIVTSILTAMLLLAYLLPVRYGVDPTGMGVKLGFSGAKIPTGTAADTNNSPSIPQTSAQTANQADTTPLATAPQMDDPLSVREDNIELIIAPKQTMDYRLAMERDYDMDYYWTANGKTVYSELRGEPKDGKAPSKTFGKLTSKSGKGFFIIPFNGQFGWHWQNKTNQPVTIRLHTKGHYQVIGQVLPKL